MRRAPVVCALVVSVLALNAVPAQAALQVGQAFAPTSGCTGPLIGLQTTSPESSSYAVPTDGVITSWSYRAGAMGSGPAQLKVARAAGGDDFTIAGQSQLEELPLNQLTTFPTRITVRAADVIGIYFPTGTSAGCAQANAGFVVHRLLTDASPGTTATYMPNANIQVDVAAALEPDGDGDGFGDESQDACPGQTGVVGGCPPDTTIVKGPKDKTKRKQATFEFSSNASGASFECELDGGTFEPCNSPKIVKVSKGKHNFQVRAVVEGQSDGSPATYNWKLKKKRKK